MLSVFCLDIFFDNDQEWDQGKIGIAELSAFNVRSRACQASLNPPAALPTPSPLSPPPPPPLLSYTCARVSAI